MNYEKMQKLTDISRLYYEQDKTQNEIAEIYGISRPLISRMLKEAKDLGIVNIEIRSPFDDSNLIVSQLKNYFSLDDIQSVETGANDTITNYRLAEKAIHSFLEEKGGTFGIGWGTIIGTVISLLEQKPLEKKERWKTVCPLVGNSNVSNRNYHSNENVRIFAQQMNAWPCYLYTPAFAETQQEMELIYRLENFKNVLKQWEKLDMALVNIGNYPSVPDFASGARYGRLLMQRKAVGRVLAYYYDQNGDIIYSNTDYAIQIPVDLLKRCKNVIAICSSNVSPKALMGALKTGLIHHLIATDVLLKQVFDLIR